ncbi:MAG: ABC transporter permease [Candidatus Polarisedimenticolia bacterium]
MIVRDLQHTLRSLHAAPGYAAMAILTLALGIGANTLIWSIVDGVVLRPLPYEDSGRLVRVFETAPGSGELRSIAHPTLDMWTDLDSFENIALYGPWSLDLSGDGRPERLEGAAVSGGFFQTLRVQPVLGRAFTPDEHRPGGPKTIVLGDALWRRRFAAEQGTLGRELALDGSRFEVIGIMPRGFAYPAGADYWVTTALDHEHGARRARHLSAIGRLRPGVHISAARAELLTVESSLSEAYPEAYDGFGIQLIPLHERIVGPVRSSLLLMMAAAGAVLLIACTNVANLTLGRASGRRREFAVRTALGASIGRIARLVVIESLVLAAIGGTVGVLASSLALDALRDSLGERLPRMVEVTLDLRVLGFAVMVTLFTGILVGLAPLLHVLQPDLYNQLRQGGGGRTATQSHDRLRGGLVVAQTAMAIVLLSAAGLLARSFTKLAAVESGVRLEGVLSFHIGLPPAREADTAYVVDFYRRLRERLEAIPGVEVAGLASRLPLSGDDHSNSFRLGNEAPIPGQERSAQDRAVSPGYFRALGIPVRGRDFSDQDTPTSPAVAIVNESFAQRYFPGQEALGEWFVPSRAGGVPRQIVGVAGDARQFGLDSPAEPEFYLPHAQDPWPWLSVVVKSSSEPLSLVRPAEHAVWSLDPSLPLTEVRTMEGIQAETLGPRRLGVTLIAVFAGLALILATIGTYGVMSYGVTQRLPEVAVRMALGAGPADVLRLVVGRGLRLAAIGLSLGLAGALAAGRLLQGMLFGVGTWDVGTLVVAAGILGGAVLLASYLPARHASRLEPLSILKTE